MLNGLQKGIFLTDIASRLNDVKTKLQSSNHFYHSHKKERFSENRGESADYFFHCDLW